MVKEALNKVTWYNDRVFIRLFVKAADIRLLIVSICFTTNIELQKFAVLDSC